MNLPLLRNLPLLPCCMMPLLASAHSSSAESEFIEGSQLSALSRNSYFNRSKQGGKHDSRDWTQGFILEYRSGYTAGTFGFGVDAFAYLGLKLDAPADKAGTGNLPVDHNGEPEDAYGKSGGALKVRVSASEFKLGEQRPDTPVFGVSHYRLIPQTATGLSLVSEEHSGLEVQAGHFTAATSPVSTHSNGDLWAVMSGVTTDTANYAGFTYTLSERSSMSIYGAHFEDIWDQYYANVKQRFDLSAEQHIGLNADFYHTTESGAAKAGELDNSSYGLSASYSLGAHRWLIGYQKIASDTPFDYLGVGDNDSNGRNGRDQGSSIRLPNSAQFADFNGPGEQSWQARYDLTLAAYGLPGLSFMTRYISGRGIDGSNIASTSPYAGRYGADGKHHELNIELRYVVQSGSARGLSVRLRQAWHRANKDQGSGDLDDFRLITDFPFEVF